MSRERKWSYGSLSEPHAAAPLLDSTALVAPRRIVDDSEFLTYVSAMVTFLLTLPWCSLETKTIFALHS